MGIPVNEAYVTMRTTVAKRQLYKIVAESEGLRVSAWLRQLADARVAEMIHRQRPPESPGKRNAAQSDLDEVADRAVRESAHKDADR